MELPSLDFLDFSTGNTDKRDNFSQKLAQQLQTCGFAVVHNHGVDKELLDEAFQWSRRFFDLPMRVKLKSLHPAESNPNRGYSFIGQENLAVLTRADRRAERCGELKESWDQVNSNNKSHPNLWEAAEEVPGFREFMESFFHTLHDAELRLLDAIAAGLNLPADIFAPLHTDGVDEFRLLHYPAVTADDMAANTRTSEHTDLGTITLLFQDSTGGLEVEDQSTSGVFHPICAASPAMIINVGDSLQRWTNGLLKSAYHRVTVPKSAANDAVIPARYSIAFFAKPNSGVLLQPFPQFVSEEHPSKYEKLTVDEYHHQKRAQVY
ncbi:Oxoglutarate/iron-dependent oxygenase [Macrophomina phaseolina MS6]|uniref:Oxoglutarate/iron-dependent oxygenase n=1 Tax=Macrophomina phaseolina (strain MS6) TaxID=1126212 RepID=K2RL16_MACPH|nr:Oxoglutarate/iron-dependent oxygenase [Macrophomina phaseolina MS6]